MDLHLSEKVVVVTGGANGIGGACTTRFLEEGALVAALDIDSEAGMARIAEYGDRGLYVQCDVSDSSSVAAAFERIVDRFGGVDVLVNNAGIQRYSTVTDTTDEEWDLVMDTNLKSSFLCARAAIPLMQERGEGVVVNVSSVQAMVSQRNAAPYVIAKSGQVALTRTIAIDYAPEIRSVAICPGSVDTPLMAWAIEQSPNPDSVMDEVRDMHLAGRMADAHEIADLILYVASDRSAFMTGAAIRIDGGLGIEIRGSKR